MTNSECDGEACYYVHVVADNRAREVLQALGCDDQYFVEHQFEDGDEALIDIAPAAWANGAGWYKEGRGCSQSAETSASCAARTLEKTRFASAVIPYKSWLIRKAANRPCNTQTNANQPASAGGRRGGG